MSLEAIRSKVADERIIHSRWHSDTINVGLACDDSIAFCRALRWAEAALKMAESHDATSNIASHDPEYCYSDANYRGHSYCDACRAEHILADIADGLK